MGGNRIFFLFFILFPIALASAGQTLSGLNLEQFEKGTDQKKIWQNNPFIQPTAEVPVSDLRVTGIVYHPEDAAAIINQTVVQVGDHIGSSEIVSIEKKRVILRNENGVFSLSLDGGV